LLGCLLFLLGGHDVDGVGKHPIEQLLALVLPFCCHAQRCLLGIAEVGDDLLHEKGVRLEVGGQEEAVDLERSLRVGGKVARKAFCMEGALLALKVLSLSG
jgi:hypothetical protein